MDLGGSVVAGSQAPELVEPGEGALDDPAVFSQAAAVGHVPFGQERLDPKGAELPAMRLAVVGPIALELFGSPAGSSPFSPDRRDAFEKGQKLGDVVPVGPGEVGREGNPPGVGEQVMLASRPCPVRGIGTGDFFPHPRPAPRRSPPPLSTSRSLRPLRAGRGAPGAAAPRPRPAATPSGAASRSSPSHIRVPSAGTPKECRFARQRGFRSRCSGRQCVSVPDTGAFADAPAAAARSVPTVHRPIGAWPQGSLPQGEPPRKPILSAATRKIILLGALTHFGTRIFSNTTTPRTSASLRYCSGKLDSSSNTDLMTEGTS